MSVVVTSLTSDIVKSAMVDIRPEDQMEWIAGIGTDVASGLMSYGWGTGKAALLEDGTPLCFWGAEDDGYVWLAATKTAESNVLLLHRVLKRELNELHHKVGGLYCWADARNKVHHKWLEWCGFTFVEEKPWGLLGLPFRHYRREP